MSYLSDIQDFAIAHQSPELLDYISKSKDAVSKMIYSGSMKQTKLILNRPVCLGILHIVL